MKIAAFIACAIVVPLVAGAATPAPVKAPATSKPAAASSKTSITMPGELGFGFKPGAGSQTATAYCLICHSSAYVSTQPPLDKAQWTAEVTKMRKAYGAPIPDKEAAEIADYLTATYGKP